MVGSPEPSLPILVRGLLVHSSRGLCSGLGIRRPIKPGLGKEKETERGTDWGDTGKSPPSPGLEKKGEGTLHVFRSELRKQFFPLLIATFSHWLGTGLETN